MQPRTFCESFLTVDHVQPGSRQVVPPGHYYAVLESCTLRFFVIEERLAGSQAKSPVNELDMRGHGWSCVRAATGQSRFCLVLARPDTTLPSGREKKKIGLKDRVALRMKRAKSLSSAIGLGFLTPKASLPPATHDLLPPIGKGGSVCNLSPSSYPHLDDESGESLTIAFTCAHDQAKWHDRLSKSMAVSRSPSTSDLKADSSMAISFATALPREAPAVGKKAPLILSSSRSQSDNASRRPDIDYIPVVGSRKSPSAAVDHMTAGSFAPIARPPSALGEHIRKIGSLLTRSGSSHGLKDKPLIISTGAPAVQSSSSDAWDPYSTGQTGRVLRIPTTTSYLYAPSDRSKSVSDLSCARAGLDDIGRREAREAESKSDTTRRWPEPLKMVVKRGTNVVRRLSLSARRRSDSALDTSTTTIASSDLTAPSLRRSSSLETGETTMESDIIVEECLPTDDTSSVRRSVTPVREVDLGKNGITDHIVKPRDLLEHMKKWQDADKASGNRRSRSSTGALLDLNGRFGHGGYPARPRPGATRFSGGLSPPPAGSKAARHSLALSAVSGVPSYALERSATPLHPALITTQGVSIVMGASVRRSSFGTTYPTTREDLDGGDST